MMKGDAIWRQARSRRPERFSPVSTYIQHAIDGKVCGVMLQVEVAMPEESAISITCSAL